MAKTKRGSPIKISNFLKEHIEPLRIVGESYDSFLRRHFGLPSRSGHPQTLRTYFIVDSPDALLVARTQAEAEGEAIILAVRKGRKYSSAGRKGRREPVIVVKEIPRAESETI